MPSIKALILGFTFALPAVSTGTNPVSLKLTALDASASAGGKIMVRVTTTNESAAPVTFRNVSRDCDYSFQVLLNGKTAAPETGYKKQLRCNQIVSELEITDRNIIVTLEPGESSSEDVLISDLYDMSLPGSYTLKADRTFPGAGHPISNLVTVTVTP